jgi:hypothetical protein
MLRRAVTPSSAGSVSANSSEIRMFSRWLS